MGDFMVFKTIGERIKELRKEKGLTQAELGEKLGVSASMVGQYENGFRKPKKDTLCRIMEALGVSYRDFFLGVVFFKEIANELEISPMTARAALEDDASVPDELKLKVLHCALAIAVEKTLHDPVPPVSADYFSVAASQTAEYFPTNPHRQRMLDAFEKLNKQGQQIAAGRVEELTEIPKYQAHDPTED